MKTLAEIKSEIADEIKSVDGVWDEKTLKRSRKRLEFLYTIEKYLEYSPNEEFVKSEIDRVFKKNGNH